MFSHRRKKTLEKAEEGLFPDHVLTHYETQAVEQKENEREEGEQRKEGKRGCETGAPMPQKRSYQISKKTKDLHKAPQIKGCYQRSTSRSLVHLLQAAVRQEDYLSVRTDWSAKLTRGLGKRPKKITPATAQANTKDKAGEFTMCGGASEAGLGSRIYITITTRM